MFEIQITRTKDRGPRTTISSLPYQAINKIMSYFHSFVFVMLDAEMTVRMLMILMLMLMLWMCSPCLFHIYENIKQPCVLTSESNDRNKLIRWTCYGLVLLCSRHVLGWVNRITGVVVLLFWLMFLKWQVCFHLDENKTSRWNVHELLYT